MTAGARGRLSFFPQEWSARTGRKLNALIRDIEQKWGAVSGRQGVGGGSILSAFGTGDRASSHVHASTVQQDRTPAVARWQYGRLTAAPAQLSSRRPSRAVALSAPLTTSRTPTRHPE